MHLHIALVKRNILKKYYNFVYLGDTYEIRKSYFSSLQLYDYIVTVNYDV